MVDLRLGDCLDVLPTLADSSIDLIVTDPPYYKVKAEDWDRQWDKPANYLRWLRRVRDEWYRLLKPNGSLYCFASPRMAARVELLIGGRFNVLNAIRWSKEAGWAKRQCKEEMRSFWPASETILFAEHYNADNVAKGEAGYLSKCDELRGFVFEPLRAYLDGERRRAGVAHRDVIRLLGMTGHDSHFFSRVQWKLPLPEQYESMRRIFSQLDHNGQYLQRPYEDLRREYEDLRREYEDLRRPFSVTPDVPYTDVWAFPTVPARTGKHPCEKPLALIEHMVRTSSRPGAVVLDCFMGSGTTGVACVNTGRKFVGVEKSAAYFASAERRIKAQTADLFAEVSRA